MTQAVRDRRRGPATDGARRRRRPLRTGRTSVVRHRASRSPASPSPATIVAGDREPARRRIATAISDWVGVSTWPAYCAAGITAAYGMLKAYWVFGGEALWSIAPLDPELIEKARSGTAPLWFEIADAISVVLAIGGVLFALATVRPRSWLPTGLVRWSLWPLSTFMVLRGALSIPGDVYEIATDGALAHTARWDLALWSPLFLVWGVLWAATALTYAHRSSAVRAGRRPE